MANYVWSATDETGESVIRNVAADSVADAREILLAAGYTNPTLKEIQLSSDAELFLTEGMKAAAANRLFPRI